MVLKLLKKWLTVWYIILTSRISLMRWPPFPMSGPHWLFGTNNLIVTGGTFSVFAFEIYQGKGKNLKHCWLLLGYKSNQTQKNLNEYAKNIPNGLKIKNKFFTSCSFSAVIWTADFIWLLFPFIFRILKIKKM